MKNKLLNVLKEIENLLRLCGYEEKASWFMEKSNRIMYIDDSDHAFRCELQELQKVIAGMGSFHDLPLYPIEGSGLTEMEAEQMQWKLADELGTIIRHFLQEHT